MLWEWTGCFDRIPVENEKGFLLPFLLWYNERIEMEIIRRAVLHHLAGVSQAILVTGCRGPAGDEVTGRAADRERNGQNVADT